MMTDPSSVSAVPVWAVELREKMARIDERTSATSTQITNIEAGIETLRRTTVPTSEHQLLMDRVDKLWNRDLQGRQEWDEMVPRVRQLWQDRAELAGTRRGYRIILTALSIVVTALTLFTLLHGLGVNVSIK